MKAHIEIRLLSRLLEIKTEMQDKIITSPEGATKRALKQQLIGLNIALDTLREELKKVEREVNND